MDHRDRLIQKRRLKIWKIVHEMFISEFSFINKISYKRRNKFDRILSSRRMGISDSEKRMFQDVWLRVWFSLKQEMQDTYDALIFLSRLFPLSFLSFLEQSDISESHHLVTLFDWSRKKLSRISLKNFNVI